MEIEIKNSVVEENESCARMVYSIFIQPDVVVGGTPLASSDVPMALSAVECIDVSSSASATIVEFTFLRHRMTTMMIVTARMLPIQMPENEIHRTYRSVPTLSCNR